MKRSLVLLGLLGLLAACKEEAGPAAEPVRPVRVHVARPVAGGETTALTGDIHAMESVALGFRTGGRVVERLGNVGDTVEAGQIGDDPERVRAIARDVATVIGSVGNTRSASFIWMEPARKGGVQLDHDEARRLGLSAPAGAKMLDLYLSGATVTQMRDDIRLVPVVARAAGGKTLPPERLTGLEISLPGGQTVPLSPIARLKFELTNPLVHRRDRESALTVQADVTPGLEAATVVAKASVLTLFVLPMPYDLVFNRAVSTGAPAAPAQDRQGEPA